MLKKKIISVFLIFMISASAFSLSGCRKEKEKFTEYIFDYFDTVTTITGYEKTKPEFDERVTEIKKLLKEYHSLYDIYENEINEKNLCSLNNYEGDKSEIKLNKKIIDLLSFSKEMYTLTNGKTNIALGSVLSIWHKYRTQGIDNPEKAEIPDMKILSAANRHTDISKIKIDTKNNTVSVFDNEILIDVGAVAKGYAVQKIAEVLEGEGVSGYLINVGGNVKAIGERPDGSKWTAGIENPDSDDDSDYLKYLKISNEAVVTSGSYQRFYTVNGKNYNHIIDPETLMPSEKFKLVSVVAKDSGIADALSTALFIMNFDDGMKLVERVDGVEALWLFNDGTTRTTDGFNKYAK